MLFFTVLGLILLGYFISGTFDFLLLEKGAKEKLRREDKPYSTINPIFKYPQWVLICASIYIAIFIACAFTVHWAVLLGLIAWYTEDVFYYLWDWFYFNRPLPKELPWLHGNIKLYKKLVGDNYPRTIFKKVWVAQFIIMILTVIMVTVIL